MCYINLILDIAIMDHDREFVYENLPGVQSGLCQTWNKVRKRIEPNTIYPVNQNAEEVSVVRTEDGKVVVMSFINAKNKFSSIVQTGSTDTVLSNDRCLEIQFLNRTSRDVIITRRNGVSLHCGPAPRSVTSRQFIVREIYRFGNIEEVKDFVARVADVPIEHQSSPMRLLIGQMRKVLLKISYGGHEDLRYVVDYRIDSHVLDVSGSIYDLNTDLVVAYKDAPSSIIHPKLEQQGQQVILSEFKVDDQVVQNIHAVKVHVASHEPKRYFYKLFGNIHVIDAVCGSESRPKVDDGMIGDEPLINYIEIWATKASATVKSEQGYLTNPPSVDAGTCLIYRVSIDDAKKRFGLFDTAELARDNGDSDKVEQEALRSEKLNLEREVAALKVEQTKAAGKNSDEEFARRLAQLTTEHEHRIKELTEQKTRDEIKFQEERKRFTDEQASALTKHEAAMDALRQKAEGDKEKHRLSMEEKQTAHKQTMVEKTTSHSNSMTESSRKDTSEIIKITGAVVVGAAAIVLAVVKLVPLITGGLVAKGAVVAGGWLASGVASVCSSAWTGICNFF
jgi:hypothetical protein